MARLAPSVESVEHLLALGQVLAWLAGLAHYRTGSLALCRSLPAPLVATAQATMKDAAARQTQSQSMLQNIIDQAETVSTDQVASEILALQTSLQASYQTTSMLSQLTLTKYL